MYGASAQLVITMKGGSVNGFTMVSTETLKAPKMPVLIYANRTTLSVNLS